MKKLFTLLIGMLMFSVLPIAKQAQETFELYSPDERTVVTISIGDQIQYAVSFIGQQVLAPSGVSLTIDGVAASFL